MDIDGRWSTDDGRDRPERCPEGVARTTARDAATRGRRATRASGRGSVRVLSVAVAVIVFVMPAWSNVFARVNTKISNMLWRRGVHRPRSGAGAREDVFERNLRRSLISGDNEDFNARARLRRLRKYDLWHHKTRGASENASVWYQNNAEPSYTCGEEERVGVSGDGGKWICNPWAIARNHRACLVYSIGSNNHFDFEQAVLESVSGDCEIHIFDHTVSALQLVSKQRKPWKTYFHQYGLSDAPSGDFKSLTDIVRMLGHEGRTIDIFKIDCEGCEWTTYESWFEAPIQISQILIELHKGTRNEDDPKKPVAKTFFESLHSKGYRIFHKEANTQWSALDELCVEYGFVQMPKSVLEVITSFQRN